MLRALDLGPEGRRSAVRDKAAQERLPRRIAPHQLGAAGGVGLGVVVDATIHAFLSDCIELLILFNAWKIYIKSY